MPADIQVNVAALLDTLIPAQLIIRGHDLGTARPTFYGVTVARGLEIQLTRTVQGKTVRLAALKSAQYFSQKWVRLTLQARGEHLRVRVVRCDTSAYLDDSGQWQASPTWAVHSTDKAIAGPGLVGLGRPAQYNGSLFLDDFSATAPETAAAEPARRRQDVQTPRPSAAPQAIRLPAIPRHYNHIRIAMLAYYGNPLGALEDRLLADSVDLVVPDARTMKHIKAVAPRTPQLLYTNTSNLYLDLLTHWLTFADASGCSREAAFYHVSKPLPFRGDSPSSQPVTWFWKVFRGRDRLTDLTAAARGRGTQLVFGSDGEALYVGYPDRFREINLALVSGKAGGWSGRLEYVRASSPRAQAGRWAPLKILSDMTEGLGHSGRITFDPPAGWRPASLEGGAGLFYIRFRTVRGGRPPVAKSLLGRDYVHARGGTSGTIPVFDSGADANHDGYLDDAEYARRSPGKDARFVYESRVFTEQYGQMRFSTNPGNAAYRRWAVLLHARLLKAHPLAAGLFVDNCDGRPQFVTKDVLEPITSFADDSGRLFQEISRAIAPRWLLMNLVDNPRADPLIRYLPAYMSEFAIRPRAHSYVHFEDLAASVARRAQLTSPPPLAILDSHPQNGVQTSRRLQLATLAYYYLLSNPKATFLMLYGGAEPATPWQRHWIPAAAYDIGLPAGKWALWASGPDPGNRGMGYRVYARRFHKALVLYKPLSTKHGFYERTSTGKETATRHSLRGTYRPLRVDATLGGRVSSITLRNGEGAILIAGR